MERDRKSTGLKLLQGLIWDEGYARGEIRGHVYPDVPPALAAWRAAGRRLRVFSSGSVHAQKLLFGHTDYGDLTPFFEGFHDTRTGPKQDPAAYTAIAAAFALPAGGDPLPLRRHRRARRRVPRRLPDGSAGPPRQPARGGWGAPCLRQLRGDRMKGAEVLRISLLANSYFGRL